MDYTEYRIEREKLPLIQDSKERTKATSELEIKFLSRMIEGHKHILDSLNKSEPQKSN